MSLKAFLQEELSEEHIKSYLLSIQFLETATRLMAFHGPQAELSSILLWAGDLPQQVVHDLHAGRPSALLLLATFAVFMAALEKSFWCIRGWAKALIRDIDSRLLNMPIVSDFLIWPRRKVWDLAL